MKWSESSKSNLETPVGILAEFRNGSPSMEEGAKSLRLRKLLEEGAHTGILSLAGALSVVEIHFALSQAGSEISDYACRRRGADGRGATRLEFTQSMVQTFD